MKIKDDTFAGAAIALFGFAVALGLSMQSCAKPAPNWPPPADVSEALPPAVTPTDAPAAVSPADAPSPVTP